MSESEETEEQIFEAAKMVFHREGYEGARMQAIADEAGINKAMLHYYYRSKDKLFQAVFQDAVRHFFPVIQKVLAGDQGIVPKVKELVDTYYGIFREHPHLPSFVIYEMNQNPQRFKQFMKGQVGGIPAPFLRQVEEEIRAGSMKQVKPHEFLVNIIALCVFPFIARSMVETVFEMDPREYERFMEERRRSLPGYILNSVSK
ncbi:MAG: TetR/AcrR family transcriptional regulator [Balneolaceae bacterium]|nr:TetR/AcrR family transcriptional regulator [Balneolaceae bacterium]